MEFVASGIQDASDAAKWDTCFIFDGGDDSSALKMADRGSALDEQVAHLESKVDLRAPDGTAVTFRCFLTGIQNFLKNLRQLRLNSLFESFYTPSR